MKKIVLLPKQQEMKQKTKIVRCVIKNEVNKETVGKKIIIVVQY